MDNSAPFDSKTGLTRFRISALCFFPLCGLTTTTNLIATISSHGVGQAPCIPVDIYYLEDSIRLANIQFEFGNIQISHY